MFPDVSTREKPRVLVVSFIASGGMCHVACGLARALSSQTPAGLVLWRSKGEGHEIAFDFPVFFVRRATMAWRRRLCETANPFFLKRLTADIVKNFTPDIVHVNWGGVWLWPFVRELRKMSVPVVVTVHDPTPHEERRPLADRLAKAWFDGWQMPRAIGAVSAIHVHSKSHENTVAERFGENLRAKTYVVPHGGGAVLPHGARSKSMPPELAEAPPTAPSNIFTILFFGRIQPYKGLHVLCRAVRDILHDTPVRLVVAGKGPIDSEWMTWLKENAILINRFIEDEEIPTIFSACHVVVLPYLSATQSGVIPLAYHYGKPVVVTAVGALPEVVEDGKTGYIVTPGSSESLAAGIRAVMTDGAYERMGREARRYLKANISWERVAARHLERYRIVLGLGRLARP